MKNIFYLLTLFTVHLCCPGFAQDTSSTIIKADYVEGTSAFKNYITNPSAEKNVSGVTCTSFTQCTRQTSTADVIQGKASYRFLSLTNGGTVKFDVKPFVGSELIGNNCAATFDYRGGGAYKAYVEINSVKVTQDYVLQSLSTTTASLPEMIYPCGDGLTATKLVIESTSTSNGDLYVDNVYLGKPRTIGQANQLGPWIDGGAITITSTGSAPTKPTTSRDKAWYRRNGSNLDVRYEFTSTATASAGTGDYLFALPASAGCAIDSSKIKFNTTTGGSSVDYGPTVGTSTVGYVGVSNATGTVRPYDTTRVRLFAGPGVNSYLPVGQANANANFSSSPLEYSADFSVPCEGWTSGNVVAMVNSNYDWTDYTPTFTQMGSPTIQMCRHKREGSDLLIECSFTGGSAGASEIRMSLPNSLVASNTKYAATINNPVGHYFRGETANDNHGAPVMVRRGEGYITFGSSYAFGSGVVDPFTPITNLAGTGFRQTITARIAIEGWTENQNAPLLVGGVTSGYQGMTRTEWVNFGGSTRWNACNSSPCTTYEQSGAVSGNITRSNTGIYVIPWATGTWSSPPACFTQAIIPSSFNGICNHDGSVTGGNMTLNCGVPNTAAGDVAVSVVCTGPR